ncbi:lysostaphin resistance A-like protein [Pantoea ananatis]|uniref:CPBP family intramembrane glutamic endopeptidase n=1 Tax=Pantoea ananas TaxID=553 RepID=UPI003D0C5915
MNQENIIYFFIMIFIGPFVEEVAFRGCLFGTLCCLCKSFSGGIIVALLMTSLIFSVMHAQYDSISAYITEFVFSVILTAIRINTKSLIYPVLAHTVLNAFAVLSLIISVIL